MPIFVYRFSRLVRTSLPGWRLPLAIVVFVFTTSWLAMWLLEPGADEISRPENYWWYFLVTAATVGYGDLSPASVGGRLVGAYVIVGGIVTLTILFTELAGYLQSAKGKRMRGEISYDKHDHVVLLGYTSGRTERMVAELGAEDEVNIVLCACADVTDHPMPEHERVTFVRGDLATADVMTRASVVDAATVVIDVRDDNETLAIAVAVHHANPGVHLVAALRDMSRCEHLRYVKPEVQCIQWHLPNLLVEETQDPGITAIYAEMMTSGGRSNTYSTRLPDNLARRAFGECQTLFGQRHGATVIAVRQSDQLLVSPSWDTPLTAGTRVYYLAASRIEDASLVDRSS